MTQQMSERQGVPIYFVHYNKLVIVRQAFLLMLILVKLKCWVVILLFREFTNGKY